MLSVPLPGFITWPSIAALHLQTCYDMTDMGVINIVLGSIMLLWCHLIWLLMLMMSLFQFMRFEVQTV
jgi:hypothetical protein